MSTTEIPENKGSPTQTPNIPSSIARRKLFIGGLSWDTSDEDFKSFFAKFGPVEDAALMRDRTSGRSRGFGFVTFEDPQTVTEVLKSELVLDGRKIDPQIAVPRDEMSRPSNESQPAPHFKRKLFIGGLDISISQEQFSNYFQSFGNIVEAAIVCDRESGKSKGFGFVTYVDDQSVDKVMNISNHNIDGKEFDCKRAVPMKPKKRDSERGFHREYRDYRDHDYRAFDYKDYYRPPPPSIDYTPYDVRYYPYEYPPEYPPYTDDRYNDRYYNDRHYGDSDRYREMDRHSYRHHDERHR